MENYENDKELNDIFSRKRNELIEKARSTSGSGGASNVVKDSPILLTDSNFNNQAGKYPLLVVDFWALESTGVRVSPHKSASIEAQRIG